MQYKGDDLDLRVPHGRENRAPRETYSSEYEQGSSNGRWARGRHSHSQSNEPLWVDEVLLACCNYAFDVAQANGAAVVDLEHLVNALTRVDAAARTLEARGVHEGQLRRESAALIASEIPAANAGDALAPRRSSDLEDVLRRASDQAHRRGYAASVDDVLWVLLHYGRDLAVVQLLRRLTPDWQRADWGRPREIAIAEPAPRPQQIANTDGFANRVAGMEDTLRLMQSEFAGERKILTDLVRDIQRDVVAQRGDGASFRSDLSQRLETLERSTIMRGDSLRLPQQIVDRLMNLEKSVQGSLAEAARATSQIGQRIAALELAVSGNGDGTMHLAVTDRINHLESALDGSLKQRFATIERLVGEAKNVRLPEEMTAKLVAIEKRLESAPGGFSSAQFAPINDRIDGIGRVVEALASDNNRARLDLAERLELIEEALSRRPTATSAVPTDLVDRIGGLESAVRSGFGDTAQSTSAIRERLDIVEKGLTARPRDDGEALLILDDRLGSIERALEARGEQVSSATHEIAERLSIIEKRPSGGENVDVSALITPLKAQLEGFDTSGLQNRIAEVLARVGLLEERFTTSASSTEEALRGRDQDFDFIYNEIKQLGQSQATLNSAVSDWRTESQGHFGTLADRFDKLQASAQAAVASEFPSVVSGARNGAHMPLGATESAEVDINVRPVGTGANYGSGARRADNVRADDYVLPPQPGRGFWYWLYGTDSVSRANKENNLKVDRMRQNIREAKERRRTQV